MDALDSVIQRSISTATQKFYRNGIEVEKGVDTSDGSP